MTFQSNFFYEETPPPPIEHPPLCVCGASDCPSAVTVEKFDPVINVGFGDKQKLKAILSGQIVTGGCNAV